MNNLLGCSCTMSQMSRVSVIRQLARAVHAQVVLTQVMHDSCTSCTSCSSHIRVTDSDHLYVICLNISTDYSKAHQMEKN